MKEFKFRVLIDTLEEDNAFRDISVDSSDSFESFHKAITLAFDFKGDQMASFYLSNEEWDKGQEIGLMDMTGENQDFIQMSNTKIREKVDQLNQKLLYVYDFLSMWCFFIELVEINELAFSKSYPTVELEFGKAPPEDSKQIEMIDVSELDFDEEKNDPYSDIQDEFDNLEDYDF